MHERETQTETAKTETEIGKKYLITLEMSKAKKRQLKWWKDQLNLQMSKRDTFDQKKVVKPSLR